MSSDERLGCALTALAVLVGVLGFAIGGFAMIVGLVAALVILAAGLAYSVRSLLEWLAEAMRR